MSDKRCQIFVLFMNYFLRFWTKNCGLFLFDIFFLYKIPSKYDIENRINDDGR